MKYVLLFFWTIVLVLSVILNGCSQVAPPCPECDEAKVYKDGFSTGYQKAKSELPVCDICLKRFSLAELKRFLEDDPCDRCAGDDNEACLDRAQCLTYAVREVGYDCYGVVINFEQGNSHALVAFPLDDGKIIFIEPWFDYPVKVEIGYNYNDNFPGNTGKNIIEKIGIFK